MKLLLLFTSLLTFNLVFAADPVIGSSFNYQGELLDNGAPANGIYDFQIELMETTEGPPAADVYEKLNLNVLNGLFTIPDVDFGDAVFNGREYYLEIKVRLAGVGGFTALSPMQRLSATPYAIQAQYLAAGGAQNGEVLQFNGSDWVGQVLPTVNPSPWTISGNTISFLGTRTGIGLSVTSPQATLHVRSDIAGENPLQVEVNASTELMVHSGGGVSVGTSTTPLATLHVRSEDAGEDPFRVQVNSSTKLMVHNNGGVSIGTSGTPPIGGAYVKNALKVGLGSDLIGDVKSDKDSNGIMKYMIDGVCSNNSSATILRSFNATLTPGTPSIFQGNTSGTCTITFPTTIQSRYFQATAVSVNNSRGITCWVGDLVGNGINTISCKRFNGTGTGSNGEFMLLVY